MEVEEFQWSVLLAEKHYMILVWFNYYLHATPVNVADMECEQTAKY
jgi:hypothetical protein